MQGQVPPPTSARTDTDGRRISDDKHGESTRSRGLQLGASTRTRTDSGASRVGVPSGRDSPSSPSFNSRRRRKCLFSPIRSHRTVLHIPKQPIRTHGTNATHNKSTSVSRHSQKSPNGQTLPLSSLVYTKPYNFLRTPRHPRSQTSLTNSSSPNVSPKASTLLSPTASTNDP